MLRVHHIIGFTLTLCCLSGPSLACEEDADCGPGATCIKREKRASGVCYGGTGRAAKAAPALQPDPMPTVSPKAYEILGDPEQIIRQQMPGKAIGGACIVTGDCPAGQECVSTGLEGRCVTL